MVIEKNTLYNITHILSCAYEKARVLQICLSRLNNILEDIVSHRTDTSLHGKARYKLQSNGAKTQHCDEILLIRPQKCQKHVHHQFVVHLQAFDHLFVLSSVIIV